MIPELYELIERGERSNDKTKQEAAHKLKAKLDEVLNSENHRWFLNKMDPKEKARRERRKAKFKSRYK